MHYWADLQLVHGFRCGDNIAANVKCQRVLVLALCLVGISASCFLQCFDTVVLNCKKHPLSMFWLHVGTPSSGLTSGAGRQYVKACPIRDTFGRMVGKTSGP